MRTERFTTRASEAIAAAQQLAEGEGNPELTALHLLLSLVDQPGGVVATAIERIGKDLHDNVTRNHRCTTMEELMTDVRSYLAARNQGGRHTYARAKAA